MSRLDVLTPRKRWTQEAKRGVVRAVRLRHVSREQVKEALGMSEDELVEWERWYG